MTLSVVRSNSGKSTHSLRPLPIVAIDGPAGAGKSTAARMLAAHLGFILIDTGAIYRCLAHKAIDQNISLQDETQLVLLCSQIQITFGRLEKNFGGGEEGLTVPTQKIYCNEIDMSELIRSPEMSLAASLVSKHPGVREALMKMQRDFGEKGGIVMEGRDIGTVIFPDAEVKFFLTADVKSLSLIHI